MQQEDSYLKLFNHNFKSSLGYADEQKETLLRLATDSTFAPELEHHLKTTVVADEMSMALETPFGRISVDFVPVTDDAFFCWAAVFRDVDEFDKPRDLYALRLSWNTAWADNTGVALPKESRSWGQGADVLTFFNCVQRVMAAKVRVSEERIAKLSVVERAYGSA